ncbi:MAG: hypothetical protein P4L56_22770 [Candidatus Sulfopaludibacter sp.]|nr:hypothetical protein [Candidatus Sulfopaludibacter sp.]
MGKLYGTNPFNPVVTLTTVLALVASPVPDFRASSPCDAWRTE